MTDALTIKQPVEDLPFLQLVPEYRDYMWGGDRLRPGELTAEAWVIYENNRVAAGGGAFAGRKLSELVSEYGERLLGKRPFQQTGARFPLLVKLLDCAQWLSIQVHPNDEQAERLEGPGFFGKTEAWHVLEANADATLIAGSKPGVSAEMLMDGIRNGTIVEQLQVSPVSAGDTIFIRPGTIHALGPGLLIYEIQQTSDLTYRVFDWNRPLSAGRKLHIEKSLDVSDPLASAAPMPLPDLAETEPVMLTECSYFRLEMLVVDGEPVKLTTLGESFQALTVIEGQARLKSEREELTLNRFESVIIPASYGAYEIHAQGALRLLKASV